MEGSAGTNSVSTVVLLTNCQGYGAEYNPARGYPSILQTLLCERRVGGQANWKVLNWSIDGATSIEYTLLSAYLRRHPPAVVLAVTGYADYREEHFREGIGYCRSDVPRVLSSTRVLRSLPPSFLMRHLRVEDLLGYWMSDHIALLRFKEYAWSWLDRRLPGIHNVFYAPKYHYLPWTQPKHPWIQPLRLKVSSDLSLQITYGPGSRKMVREYLDVLAAIPAKTVVVAEPAKLPDTDRFHPRFLDDLGNWTKEGGLTYWDLSSALSPDGFLTSGHLNRENHARFAALLADRMAEWLGGAPASTR
jgi:hypothetical protein